MNTKGVEDGIVCEFCGTHCYQGAEHNARVEDNARFDKPAAVPVEERRKQVIDFEWDVDRFAGAARDYVNSGQHILAAFCAQLSARCAFLVHPELRNCDPILPVEERTQDHVQNLRYATQIAEYLHKNCYPEVTQWKPISGDLFGVLMQIDNMCTGVQRKPIPEERTAEIEQPSLSTRKACDVCLKPIRRTGWFHINSKDGDACNPLGSRKIRPILDHIEGKAKAESIQEVKE